MAKREIIGYVKMQIKGARANPSPPVGPALGQRGINIMEFCKVFNERTKNLLDKLVGRLKGSNLKKFSLVSNSSLDDRRRLEDYISKSGVEFKTFSSFAKASEWLLVPELDDKEWESATELSF